MKAILLLAVLISSHFAFAAAQGRVYCRGFIESDQSEQVNIDGEIRYDDLNILEYKGVRITFNTMDIGEKRNIWIQIEKKAPEAFQRSYTSPLEKDGYMNITESLQFEHQNPVMLHISCTGHDLRQK